MRFLFLIDWFGEISAWIRVFGRSGYEGLDDGGRLVVEKKEEEELGRGEERRRTLFNF